MSGGTYGLLCPGAGPPFCVPFPRRGSNGQGAAASGGGAGGPARWASTAGSRSGGKRMNAQDFPSLPASSSGATGPSASGPPGFSMAARVGGMQQVRVVNVARPQQPRQELPSADDFPTLSGGAPASVTGSSGVTWVKKGKKSEPEGHMGLSLAGDDFPSLAGTGGGGGRPASGVFRGVGGAGSFAAASAGGAARAQQQQQQAKPPPRQPPSGTEFPVLERQQAPPQAPPVTESLRAANKALIDKIRLQLDDQSFRSFREQSAAFMRGEVEPAAYYELVQTHRLVPLIHELTALCPDYDKRTALLRLHMEATSAPAARANGKKGSATPAGSSSNSNRAAPPAAAPAASPASSAAAPEATSPGTWPCQVCTLVNPDSLRSCEACGAAKPGQSKGGAAGAGKKGKMGKGTKILLTGGNAAQSYDVIDQVAPKHPGGSAWGPR